MEWLRHCYSHRWRLFQDLTITTRGRYYWALPGTPHYPELHNFGSKIWTSDERSAEPALGELPGRTTWFNGAFHGVRAPAVRVGNQECLESGERWPLPIVNRTLVDGIDSRCYPGPTPGWFFSAGGIRRTGAAEFDTGATFHSEGGINRTGAAEFDTGATFESDGGINRTGAAEFDDFMPIPGEIIAYGAASTPSGYLLCDGSAVSRTTYAALFTAIGTTWGVGDGSTTFNLPELRGRTLIDDGTGPGGLTARTVGQNGGAETHTLTLAEAPAHTHTVGAGGPAGVLAPTKTTTGTTTVTTSSQGGGGAHNNMQPWGCVRYLIKT